MPDELDTLLDQAIKTYSAAELSPDLAARILRQAQQEPAPRHNRWRLALVIALPVAAALTLAFILPGHGTLPMPPATIASTPTTPSVARHARPDQTKTVAATTQEQLPLHRHVRKAVSRSSWARPLPPPYSEEELALLNFVQQHPKEAAEIAEAQKRNLANPVPQPITIKPLHTEPLTIAALN